jgi:cell division septation protein DedD
MADTSEHDLPALDYWAETFVYVFWKQATPSLSEVAALHRIDPALRAKSLTEVAAELKDEDWWRLGPLLCRDEVNSLMEHLRSAGFSVETKQQ